MRESGNSRNSFLNELISLGLSVVGGLMMAYWCGSFLDPNREERRRNKKYALLLNKRLKRKLDLTPMELMIADTVVNPDDIDVVPDSIYAMDDIYQDLLDKAVRPLELPGVFKTTLWCQTRGVLLYGRPGTGKTMLAKALAKSCGCFFMNVSVATVQSKWYGDAQKLVRAIFTLAEKLQPCIVFIDEVDSFLTTRGGMSEHEASLSVKTEFMQHWEGMSTRRNSRILVMGTTNRREAIDPAVLRRFALQCEIPLPNESQRERIIRGYLQKHVLETEMGDDVIHPDILRNPRPIEDGLTPLEWIARQTEGYSGSHLLEVCAQAAKIPIIEAISRRMDGCEAGNEDREVHCRSCGFEDFKKALATVAPTLQHSEQSFEGTRGARPAVSPADELLRGLFQEAIASMTSQSSPQNGRNVPSDSSN